MVKTKIFVDYWSTITGADAQVDRNTQRLHFPNGRRAFAACQSALNL